MDQGMTQIIMIVLLIGVFYFMMIRPQQKRQKEIRNFRNGIKEGDRVTTAGGILGKVKKVKQSTFLLEISSGVVIEIDKNSVYPSAPQPGDNPDSQKLEPGNK
ncbi:MAG: preprotein translocase subunit YajC [Pseudoflavonifractor sp.]|nr:preprotein translocase subunit YajC [Pseudoflavonifractor sp.]